MLPEVSHWRGPRKSTVLRRPHLVLADAGGDDGLAARPAVDLLDHVVRLDERAGAVVVHGVDAPELGDLRAPRAEVGAEAAVAAVAGERAQRLVHQPDVAPVHALDLVDLGAVDVEVRDAARVARELVRHARHPVIEARAHRDQEVAVIDRVVGEGRAVHAEHAQRQRARGVERADAHERGDHRDAEAGRELGEAPGGVAVDHPAAGVDERPVRLGQHGEEARGGRGVDARPGELLHAPAVARDRQHALAAEHPLPVLHVLGHVHDHRSGTPGAGDLEGGAHGALEARRVGDEEDVLRDRAHERRHRGLLEGVGADGRRRDLAGNDYNRYRISHAVAHWCNSVGRPGTGGHDAHPHPAARPGVARGHETRPLLVGRHDERDLCRTGAARLLVVEEHGVEGRQDGPAAVAEDGGHALVREHLHDHAGAGHALAGQGVPGRAWLDDRVAHWTRCVAPKTRKTRGDHRA